MPIDTPGQVMQTPELYYIQLSWVENWVISAICSAFGSGLLVLLYAKCVVLVWAKQSQRSRGMRYFLLAYMSTLMSLSLIQTIMFSLVGVGSVRRFIAEVGHQYFPVDKAECSYCDTAEIVGQVCAGVVIWAMDGFMIWRCMVLYRDLPRFRRLALCIFIIVVGGASLTGGILCLVPSLAPGLISVNIPPWRPVAGSLSVFVCVTLFTNIIFTALVSVRLWLHQSKLQELLGPTYGSIYRRIVVILLESAALVVMANITLIILLFLSLPSATPVACSVIHVYVASPLIILYRIHKQQDAAMGVSDFNITRQLDQCAAERSRLEPLHFAKSNIDSLGPVVAHRGWTSNDSAVSSTDAIIQPGFRSSWKLAPINSEGHKTSVTFPDA